MCAYAMILLSSEHRIHTETAYDLYDDVCVCVNGFYRCHCMRVSVSVHIRVSMIQPRWIQTKRIHAYMC